MNFKVNESQLQFIFPPKLTRFEEWYLGLNHVETRSGVRVSTIYKEQGLICFLGVYFNSASIYIEAKWRKY